MQDRNEVSRERKPHFGKLDPETSAEKQEQYEAFRRSYPRREASARLHTALITLAGICLGLIVLAFSLYVLNQISFRRSVEVTLDGVEWSLNDSALLERRTVTLQGTWERHLLDFLKDVGPLSAYVRQSQFTGTLTISGYPELKDTWTSFNDGGRMMPSMLLLKGGAVGSLVRTEVRSIGWTGNFQSLVFRVSQDGAWGGGYGSLITAPAETREEAAVLTKRVAKRYPDDILSMVEIQ